MKKFLSILLLLALVVTAFHTGVYAEDLTDLTEEYAGEEQIRSAEEQLSAEKTVPAEETVPAKEMIPDEETIPDEEMIPDGEQIPDGEEFAAAEDDADTEKTLKDPADPATSIDPDDDADSGQQSETDINPDEDPDEDPEDPEIRELTGIVLKKKAFTYTGKEIRPDKYVVVYSGEDILSAGEDYTVSYKNNINAGEAAVTVRAKGDFQGKLSASFTIRRRSIANAAVTGVKSVVYTGKKITQIPKVRLTLGSRTFTLKQGTDYRVSFSDNKNAGTATMKIIGKGNFRSSIIKTFEITKRSIKKAKVTGIKNVIYTGKAIKQDPVVRIVLNGKTVKLKKGRDYKLTYKDNVEVGIIALVTVNGIGNYKDSLNKTFMIKTPTVTSVDKDPEHLTAKVLTPYSYKNMRVAVWSSAYGQDDLGWYTMKKTSFVENGGRVWTASVPYSNLADNGTCIADFYAGDNTFLGRYEFKLKPADRSAAIVHQYEEQIRDFRNRFINNGTRYSDIDFVQAAVSIANNDYYGYGHSWKHDQHTISCAGLVGLSLTYCGYGDFIKSDPQNWGYIDLGTYSGYNWCSVMEKEVGATWHAGLDGLQPGDILYYDYSVYNNHTGIYIGNGMTVEARGPEGGSQYDSSGAEIAVYSNWFLLPWQGYYRIPADRLQTF